MRRNYESGRGNARPPARQALVRRSLLERCGEAPEKKAYTRTQPNEEHDAARRTGTTNIMRADCTSRPKNISRTIFTRLLLFVCACYFLFSFGRSLGSFVMYARPTRIWLCSPQRCRPRAFLLVFVYEIRSTATWQPGASCFSQGCSSIKFKILANSDTRDLVAFANGRVPLR